MFIMYGIIVGMLELVQRKIEKKWSCREGGSRGFGGRGLGKKGLTLAPVPVVIVAW
jgi:hypothetical protein